MKYSHNSFFCNDPVYDTLRNNLDALEFDLMYRMFSKNIYCSHSWRPLNCMYYGKLERYLFECYGIAKKREKVLYFIIEPKTCNPLMMEPLYKLLNKYRHEKIIYVMSVQYKKGPHQWLRGLWLKRFFRLYKEKLGILDKRLETDLHEQVDLYEKKWYHF